MRKETAKLVKAGKRLTAKELRFVDEYMIDLNASKACLRAGYKTKNPDVISHTLLSRPRVAAEIANRQAEFRQRLDISAERVLKERARLAFFDPRKLFNDDGSPKSVTELDDDTAAAIAGLDVVSIGNAESGVGQVLKYKISDKSASLAALEKHLGLYEPVKLEHSGEIKQVTVTYVDKHTDSESI